MHRTEAKAKADSVPLGGARLASPRRPRTTRDLTAAQRALLQVMREYQFGHILNMPVRAGQPLLDQGMKIVRVALLGGESGGTKVPGDGYELKKAVRDLFDELARLDSGTVVRLEFKRGLPCLIETAAEIGDSPNTPAPARP
jgi:hypothetical protein